MAYRYTEDDLRRLGLELQPDGSYRKKASNAIASNKINMSPEWKEWAENNRAAYHSGGGGYFENIKSGPDDAALKIKEPDPRFIKITLTLFGVPMPKQSVRSYANGSFTTSKKTGKKVYNVLHYQPAELTKSTDVGKLAIKKQLPEGFVPFSNEVHIRNLHFVFPPLKSFQKIKGRMEDIHNGKFFNKTSKPDIDNICKYALDLLKGVVFTDDNLIVSINMKKSYGSGGMTIIELEGY